MLFRILTANNIRTENRGTSNCRLKLKTGLNSNHVPHFRVDPQIFFSVLLFVVVLMCFCTYEAATILKQSKTRRNLNLSSRRSRFRLRRPLSVTSVQDMTISRGMRKIDPLC